MIAMMDLRKWFGMRDFERFSGSVFRILRLKGSGGEKIVVPLSLFISIFYYFLF